MGSDESYFNVSLIVRDKVTRQCLQTTTLKREESRSGFDRSPSAYQPNVIPLGQTDSKHTHTHTARTPDRCFISYRVCSSRKARQSKDEITALERTIELSRKGNTAAFPRCLLETVSSCRAGRRYSGAG